MRHSEYTGSCMGSSQPAAQPASTGLLLLGGWGLRHRCSPLAVLLAGIFHKRVLVSRDEKTAVRLSILAQWFA